jgi:hypothetical protein
MKDDLARNLSSRIDPPVVADLIAAYQGLVAKHRGGDTEAALTKAEFVEHVFRALGGIYSPLP